MIKMANVYVNQPLQLRLDTETVLTGATLQIRYKNPNGTTGLWAATASGTVLVYSIAGNVLTTAGEWEFRAWVTFSGAVAPTPGKPVFQLVEAV
jgi:hypothetical protein